MRKKNDPDSIVRDIKRKTRKKYNSEEKIRIVLEGLRGEESIATICRREGINTNLYYKWSKDFMEAGKKRLSGDIKREATSSEVTDLKQENDQVVDIALELPDKSPRDLAWHITDSYGYNISGSSVYRILKSYDLIMSPAYIVISAADHFKQPTKRVHELWQTDFSYFRIIGWGWYYLSTVMMITHALPWRGSLRKPWVQTMSWRHWIWHGSRPVSTRFMYSIVLVYSRITALVTSRAS